MSPDSKLRITNSNKLSDNNNKGEVQMQRTRLFKSMAIVAAAGLAFAACGDDEKDSSTTDGAEWRSRCLRCQQGSSREDQGEAAAAVVHPGAVRWLLRSAVDQGCYAEAGLDVEILQGAVEIVPQDVLASGGADFALAWVPKALASREAGANIVDIAQIFQRSGTLQVSFKEAGITSSADFAGKKIGSWGFGNEFEIFAALGKAGLDPATDVEIVGQNFDMSGLLAGDIDAAEAMTYNEYAQVLEAENPDTGELYTRRRPQRRVVRGRRRRHVAGRDLGRRRAVGQRSGIQDNRDRIREGLAEGLGILPRQRGERAATS